MSQTSRWLQTNRHSLLIKQWSNSTLGRQMNVSQIVSWPDKVGKSAELLEFPFCAVRTGIHHKTI